MGFFHGLLGIPHWLPYRCDDFDITDDLRRWLPFRHRRHRSLTTLASRHGSLAMVASMAAPSPSSTVDTATCPRKWREYAVPKWNACDVRCREEKDGSFVCSF